MKALLYSFVVSIGSLVTYTHGVCSICPDGVDDGLLDADPTGDGSNTCAEIEILFQGLDRFSCLAQKPRVMPNCCPSQLSTYAVDNVCGWCSNGVPDVYKEIPDILGSSNTTCLNYMELVSFTDDSDGCNFFDRAASVCCPDDAGPVFKCEFCSQGLDFPELDPEDDGSNCTVLQSLIGLVPDETSCRFFKLLELSCCPSTTELKPCEFCSQGLDSPDLAPFQDGSTCTDLQKNATAVAEGALCEFVKAGEAFCCPSQTDNYVCDFCNGGLQLPNQTLNLEDLELSDFGEFGEDATCQDMTLLASFVPNATTCELVKSFEGVCCPSTQDQEPPPTTTSPPDSRPPPTTPNPTPPLISTPPPTSKTFPQNPTPIPDAAGDSGSGSFIRRSMMITSILCAFTALVSF